MREDSERDRRPLRMPFLTWLQRRVGLEPTPTIFFSTTRCRDRRRFYPRPLGEGQGEGGFGSERRPLRMPFRAWLQRRVGLEPTPTIFFTNIGRRGRQYSTCVNSRSKFTSHSRVMFTTHDRVDGYHQKAQIYNLAFLIASFLREIWR